ncbi:MAG: shikimate kinase [Bacteroidota bacterium]|nr:shikimate kinase [Bacteroidota bacterium]
MKIFLIGFMGSGKSTIGKRLAKLLDYSFVDMDLQIEKVMGKPVISIFSEDGEDFFRKTESEVLNDLIKGDNIVIATGGGCPCHSDNMKLINQNGISIYFKMAPESLFQRLINARRERPLISSLSQDQLLVYIKNTLNEREEYYLKSNFIVKGESLRAETLLDLLNPVM